MLAEIPRKVKEGVHNRAEMRFPSDDEVWKKINATACKDVKKDSECVLDLLQDLINILSC